MNSNMMTYYFMGQSFDQDEVDEIRGCLKNIKASVYNSLEYVGSFFVTNKKNID